MKVSVIGIGYIGLPLAAVLASKGAQVVGVDKNPKVVSSINAGIVGLSEGGLDEMVRDALACGNLRASMIIEAADVFVIAVPTPVSDVKKPVLDMVDDAAASIASVIAEGNLVIIESTCPVGTTDRIAAMVQGMRPDLAGKLHFAYCPERVLPGNIVAELIGNDRVVGGTTGDSADRAARFYSLFVKGSISITDAKTAEMVKLVENSFRDVNIALANEISLVCEEKGISALKVMELANRHPRVNLLRPGIGVGGHCIAVDPWFLIDSAPQITALLRTARNINDGMPCRVADKIIDAARRIRGKDKKIVSVLGITYKPNVGDTRESPAVAVTEKVAGVPECEVLVSDPWCEELPDGLIQLGCRLVTVEEAVSRADLLVLLVGHDCFRHHLGERGTKGMSGGVGFIDFTGLVNDR
ncbi:MAG: nucleotide sugar dehydrogenase [Negativicutes bacterium]|nr:nucleotide sugar dehydrogenase [Negativicutes bacterium]